jgi:hypothetical protein
MSATPPQNADTVHPFRTDGNLGFRDYPRLREYGASVEVPQDDAERHRIALELICSRGVPSYLTPWGSVRSVAAFAIGATDDPFYNDGEVLFRAALRARQEGHHEERDDA